MKKIYSIIIAIISMSCSHSDIEVQNNLSLDAELEALITSIGGTEGLDFFKFPESTDFGEIPQDPKNPITSEKVLLGSMLFHEPVLGNQAVKTEGLMTYSCASCHHSKAGFQAGTLQGIGEGGTGFGLRGENRLPGDSYNLDELDVQPIRTPSAMNGAYQKVMLWNGQFGATGLNSNTESMWSLDAPTGVNFLGYEGLESQAIAGLKVHRMQVDSVILFDYQYKMYFDQAFPEMETGKRYSNEAAGLAIAAYERTIMSSRAPFQYWLKGDKSVLSENEKKGAILFFGKANCVSCHTGPSLNSDTFHALAMADFTEEGVYGVTQDKINGASKGRGGFTGYLTDMYTFKVPQLYNLVDAPFYGHGGSYRSLFDVVTYKNEGTPENKEVPVNQISELFEPLNLTEEEISHLTIFLEKSLYDPELSRYDPSQLLSGMCFPNADKKSLIDLGCE